MRVVLACLSLSAVACGAARPESHNVWLPTYAWGAIGGGELDLRDVCPGGAAKELSVGASWATLGVSVATLGIYTPREAKVQCAAQR